MHLVDGFTHDHETGLYTLRIDPRIIALFSNNEYALIDWSKRVKIAARKDMAKFLQRFISTSKNSVQRYAVADLKDRMLYIGRMRDFQLALDQALPELARVELVRSHWFETSTRGKNQVAIHRAPTDT